MLIHGLTVSVDYSAELAQSIDRWMASLASLVVITAARDEATIDLARRAGANLLITEAFTEHGALMNKGAALQQARERFHAGVGDWHLLIDADVIPPLDWLSRVVVQEPRAGELNGARRVRENGERIPDTELAGFFQLWHSSDPRAAAPLATNFYHAGNYDSAFIARWPLEAQRVLDLELVHLGEPGQNWCGKGNRQAMRELRRRRRSHDWRTETVKRVG